MSELDDFEVAMLLDAIEHRWGYDFHAYARASIKRRIKNTMIRHRVTHVSELIPRVLHEEGFFQNMMRDFSVTVTELFRDPPMWQALVKEVFPILRTWPYFKIWHAACATGEAPYSLAILLDEAGLLDRATIYATDYNDTALQSVWAGIYPIKEMQKAGKNYLKAGGQHSLSHYYTAYDDAVRMNARLRDAIHFANHNLVTDRAFGEMNLILCRNALIYFTQPLQNRALELFTASLTRGGFLCLGSKESLDFSSVSGCYDPVNGKERLYKRVRCDEVAPADFALSHAPVSTSKDTSQSPAPSGVLAIGCSMGGLQALQTLLPALPANFPLPVLVTQHISDAHDSAMAEVLQQHCALTIKEAANGDIARAGWVYLAPPGYHLLLDEGMRIDLSSDERDHYARPSINVMFESVADVCGVDAIGVLLTGANADGAKGLALIKAAGGYAIVQDPADAVAPAMPQAALDALKPDRILPLARIATAINTRARIVAAGTAITPAKSN